MKYLLLGQIVVVFNTISCSIVTGKIDVLIFCFWDCHFYQFLAEP